MGEIKVLCLAFFFSRETPITTYLLITQTKASIPCAIVFSLNFFFAFRFYHDCLYTYIHCYKRESAHQLLVHKHHFFLSFAVFSCVAEVAINPFELDSFCLKYAHTPMQNAIERMQKKNNKLN